MGTAPIITDDEIVLPESGAIVEYVITGYGKGRLAIAVDRANYSEYLFWFHFANGTMMPAETGGIALRYLGLSPDNPIVAMRTERFGASVRSGGAETRGQCVFRRS